MKVKDIVQKLNQYSQEAEVFVDDNVYNFLDIREVTNGSEGKDDAVGFVVIMAKGVVYKEE